MTAILPPTDHGTGDDFEARLGVALHRLADQAPATVRAADELGVLALHARDERPSPRRRAAGIGGTLALLAGAAGIGVVAFNAASDGGGAGTPEEAVVLLLDAIEHEDVLAVLDVVDPAEVDSLKAVVDDITTTAQQLELLDESFSLDGIAGVDIATDGVTFRTDTLDADLAVVTATTGTATATFDPAAFPYGDILAEATDATAASDDPASPTSATLDLATGDPAVMVATVERDGRWYVSISYTIAEYARRDAGVDAPSAPAVEPVGFDSPEAAVQGLYDRLLAGDLTGAVATAAPGEGDALRRYAPLWLPGAEETLDREVADGLAVQLDQVGFTVTGDGDHRTVHADSFVISGTVPADWSATDDMQVEGDPALPTIVYSYSGDGWYMIPAGSPVPATVDGLELLPWSASPPEEANGTAANQDGTIVPVRFPGDDPAAAPIPVHVDRADGCTTLDAGAAAVFGVGPNDAWDDARPEIAPVGDDGSVRICGSPSLLGGFVLLTGSSPIELPAVATVQVGGRWYVSPLGTVATSILDALRNAQETGILDSPLSWLIYGTSRSSLEASLVGLPVDGLSAECAAIVTSTEGTVSGIVEQPDIADARACQETMWSAAIDEGAQAPVIETETVATAAP